MLQVENDMPPHDGGRQVGALWWVGIHFNIDGQDFILVGGEPQFVEQTWKTNRHASAIQPIVTQVVHQRLNKDAFICISEVMAQSVSIRKRAKRSGDEQILSATTTGDPGRRQLSLMTN